MNLPYRVHAHLAPTLLAVTVGLILAGCGGEPHTVTAQPDAAPVDQSLPPQVQTQPSAPSASSPSRAAVASDRAGPQGPAVVAEPGSGAQATEQQIDALRKRLEARRARQQQQQQQKQQPQSPAKNQ